MAYKLSQKSLSKLEGVHPDLVKVVKRAIEITECDFTITEGLRTKERQAQLLKEKKTTTMNSRHLTGHAVDLAAWIIVDKKGTVSWDWKYYYTIEKAMKNSAKELEVSIEWGGDWKSFPDAPHWQLPFKQYPK